MSRQHGTTHLKAGLTFLYQIGLLDHDYGVGAARDDTSGGNRRAEPWCNCFNGHMTTGNYFRIERQHLGIAVVRTRGVDRTHGKAIDIRAVERRGINRGNDVLREHAAARIGERHVLRRKGFEIEMLLEA